MSEKSGISVSTLSKVEHDRLTLSYDKLQLLSRRLNIRMSELFAEDSEPEVQFTARRSFGELENALRVTTPNYDYHYLCTELRKKRMIPAVVHIKAKNVHEFGKLVTHPGEEFIYVLEGSIILHTDFYDPVTMKQGQSVYLDSTMGHAYLSASNESDATVLAICASAEEDLMGSLIDMHGEHMPRPGDAGS
jgi:transcriptional regulator with XRE-family HTH domain